MSLLEVKELRIEFPNRHGDFIAVDKVSFELQPGEILGLVGESGAGKSTVGNAIIGLLEAPGKLVSGEVYLNDQRIDNLSDAKKRLIRGKRIGMIFQDPQTSLDPLQTIEEQLVETINLHLQLSEKEAKARAIDLLDQVGIPDPSVRIKLYPHQFSGGMRQRVVIALALCADPEVIIADEPTTALDVSIQAQVLELIKTLCREKQVGMVIVTHDMGVIADVADRVAVMYKGNLVEQGATAKILKDPDHPYTKSLISAVPPAHKAIHRFPLVTYIEDVKARPENIDLSTHWLGRKREFTKTTDNIIEVKNLSMQFVIKQAIFAKNRQYLNAVKGVSFSLKEGDTFGLVGESGSGKSTIARMIAGLYQPSHGEILFDGVDLTQEADLNPFRKKMQMIFQDPFSSLNGRMRVADIVAEPIRFHKMVSTEAEVQCCVADLLDHVGLGKQAATKYPHEFSGGQRQRIAIARALATRPRFLICDEPTSALDVSIQAQILNLLKDLQEELQLTMLFISHDLPVIRSMCNNVGVMKMGEMCEIAPTEELFENPQHSYSQKLIELMPRLDLLDKTA
jgi:peptide/nickel transport system ATP-binding protein